ncbi:MarR family winged helix-turn-helix transcriptional regulator [Desulfoscipio sp. XC116]|uniref:MarR family winged helix-turn-helix transcriptional regulator n=1 Tax=Desulfoscipio sp. XC116 TaxID=3144975 RepID=UPI00325B24A5
MKISLDDSLGFILNRTNIRMKNILLHKFKDYDITPEQWAVLNCLWIRDGISPKELAGLTHKDQPTTVRILSKLETKGSISRQVNPGDHRSFLIFLTTKGRALKNILIPLAAEALDKATKDIDQSKINLVKDTLNQIYKNLEA